MSGSSDNTSSFSRRRADDGSDDLPAEHSEVEAHGEPLAQDWHEDWHGDPSVEDWHPEHDPDGLDGMLSAGHGESYVAAPRSRRRRSPRLLWGALAAALVVVVVGGFFAVQSLSGLLPSFSFGTPPAEDYPGPGTGEVSIEIPEGAGGGQIGQVLADADIVASAEAFTAAAVADNRAATIQPGTYLLAEQMNAKEALERLLDPAYRTTEGVTVREGLWKEEVFAALAEGSGKDVAEYEAVDPDVLGLPEAANGDVEGYLFPDTYSFGPETSPEQQLQTMVDLGKQRYAELGLEGEQLETMLVKASLIQAEAAFSDDLPKVARVIENRLEENMPLGFDSSIHYMFKERGRAGTTDQQRETEDPYNTYLNPGLPPGPINSPGAAAIEAAVSPAEGPWLYFVTVDPSSGETNFATTFEEHQQNVELFQKWCRDNPDGC